MRRLRRLVMVSLIAGALLVATALAGAADHVPPHRHFIVTPNGELVQVGPDICTNPDLGTSFDQFHFNIHRGTPALQALENPNNPVGFTFQIPC